MTLISVDLFMLVYLFIFKSSRCVRETTAGKLAAVVNQDR